MSGGCKDIQVEEGTFKIRVPLLDDARVPLEDRLAPAALFEFRDSFKSDTRLPSHWVELRLGQMGMGD